METACYTDISPISTLSCRSLTIGVALRWTEAVFEGSYKTPKYVGDRNVTGYILSESYGAQTQQHTFTIQVTEATGTKCEEVLALGKVKRKGRNLYKQYTVLGVPSDYKALADEKHQRGAIARSMKEQRL